MFRLSGVLCMVLAILCGGALFWTSQSVQKAERKLSQAVQNNQTEQETLRVLSAEWDYLNRPARLEKLTKGNLDMDEVLANSENFIQTTDDIPQPVTPVIPKMKPEFLQHVSTKDKAAESNVSAPRQTLPPKVIEKSERENFNQLIENFVEEGAP